MTTKPCLHFVGFRDPQKFANAVRVFGQLDFVHVAWDIRARFGGELDLDHDRIVFAKGTFDDTPSPFSFDDSAVA